MTADRRQLLTLLQQWKEGVIDESGIQQAAEALLEQREDVDELPEHDDRSIAAEVLLYLDSLPGLLVTNQDIDAIADFLSTPNGEAADGWRRWRAYWESVDETKRRSELRGHPFYFA